METEGQSVGDNPDDDHQDNTLTLRNTLTDTMKHDKPVADNLMNIELK